MCKIALITGITGQDGSFLAELLTEKGYRVVGLARKRDEEALLRLPKSVEMYYGDLINGYDISNLLQEILPHEIYNLASQSKPSESWGEPVATLMANAYSVIELFEAVKTVSPDSKIFHASSAEMYGNIGCCPQREDTPFQPVNPYAASKVYAHNMARIYRESYGLFISTGILFNHESNRRPMNFVSQKVAYGAACASLGISDSEALNEIGRPIVSGGKVSLGNLNVHRDWGSATDFVIAMWLMLQCSSADDFVLGTGKLHSLKDLCEAAYGYVGLDWESHVTHDSGLDRPADTQMLLADISKAQRVLNWLPRVSFAGMVEDMVDAHIERLSR